MKSLSNLILKPTFTSQFAKEHNDGMGFNLLTGKSAVQYDLRENYKFDKIGVVKRSDFKSHDDYIAYRKYGKEHDASEGFDIKHFPRQLDSKKTLQHLCTSDKPLLQACEVAVRGVLQYLEIKNEDRLKSAKINEYQSVIFRHRCKLDLHVFRKKGDVRGVVKCDCRDSYEFIPIAMGRESNFKSQADFNAYRIYSKEYNDSEGFDIEHSDPCAVMGALHPVEDTSILERCETAVKNVLNYLERKEVFKLEFQKLSRQITARGIFFMSPLWPRLRLRLRKAKRKGTCSSYVQEKREKLKPKVAKPVVDARDDYEFLPATQLSSSEFEDHSEYCNYEKYVKEHDVSEGFDIGTFFTCPAFRRLYKAEYNRLEHCKVAVERVVDYLRSQYEENLKLVKITKANYRLDNTYFVTFKAKDKVSGQINANQSIMEYANTGWIYLDMFRKKEVKKLRCMMNL
ncbi:hypothetical protein M5689_020376 [Euphorbia peplus]|nr:hypothetical protein M5689_020376 [Euphorbia peplus]